MTPQPLWELADYLAEQEARARRDAALAKLLGAFTETATHPTYGRYGGVPDGSGGTSRVNRRTHDALVIAGYVSGWGAVRFTQGGLNASAVAASAKTHNGLDVGDVATRGRSTADIYDLVDAGMDCGVIIFIRGTTADPISDGMVPHGHCVMVGAQHAHPDARAQIYNPTYGYAYGGAGLAGLPNANWWGPKRKPLIEWKDSRYNPANGWRP